MWVRWEDGKPVEYLVRRPGERLPDRDTLGHTHEGEWETGPGGEPKDPWANTRLVYLANTATAEAYTFSTSSWGGRAAVIELGDQIARMRSAHPDATPIVELRSAEMTTRFGPKSRPAFRVVGFGRTSTARIRRNRRPPAPEPEGDQADYHQRRVRRWLVSSRCRPRRTSKSTTGRKSTTIPYLFEK